LIWFSVDMTERIVLQVPKPIRGIRGHTAGERVGKLTLLKTEDKKDEFGIALHLFRCNCGRRIICRWKEFKGCGECDPTKHKSKPKLKTAEQVFCSYKYGAGTRRLCFELTLERFLAIIGQPCFYCGEPPQPYNGVDRVNNNDGYTSQNSVSCCARCNRCKSTQTEEEFLNWVKRVYNHQLKKVNCF
jgi:hypothetical protein